jgi:hypothetical protein
VNQTDVFVNKTDVFVNQTDVFVNQTKPAIWANFVKKNREITAE